MTQSFLKKLPNRLTMSRVILVFVFVILANIRSDMPGFFIPKVSENTAMICHITGYIVAILAGITDFFDGFLARKYKLETDFGRLMDPLADKIFVVGTFVSLAEYQLMPGWIIIVVLTREFMVTGLRMLATRKGVVIAADRSGKYKTAFQMFILLLAGFSWAFGPLIGFSILQAPWWTIWYILLLIMTALTLYSGVGYFVKNKHIYMDFD